MALIFLLLPPLLSSLVDVLYEFVHPHGIVEVLVFDLGHLAEAILEALSLWPLSLCLLRVGEDASARRRGRAEVLVFDLVDVVNHRPQNNLSKQRRLMKHFLGVVFACSWFALLLPSSMLE